MFKESDWYSKFGIIMKKNYTHCTFYKNYIHNDEKRTYFLYAAHIQNISRATKYKFPKIMLILLLLKCL